MNQADNEASNRAIDSLINYETVKVYTYINVYVDLNSYSRFFFFLFYFVFIIEVFQ